MMILIIVGHAMNLNLYAALGQVRVYENQPIDGGVKLKWYTVGNATDYLIKRAETRDGNYVTIAENITDTTYTDMGLENAKMYHYKVIAKNATEMGPESDVISVAPSKVSYLWFVVDGYNTGIRNFEIYDIEGNKIFYEFNYPNSNYYKYTYFKSDSGRLFNYIGSSNTYIPPSTKYGLKLNANKGIEKIKLRGRYASSTVSFYKSHEKSFPTNVEPFGILDLVAGKNSVYELFTSGLKTQGYNKEIRIEWQPVDDVKQYVIKRSEEQNGSFELVANNIIGEKYIDKGLENGKTYYYNLEAVKQSGEIVNLGTASATTSAVNYFIVDIEGMQNDSTYNIEEVKFLDMHGNTIEYSVLHLFSSVTPTDYDMYSFENQRLRNFPYLASWYDDKTTTHNGYNLPRDWYRYSIRLHENNGVSKIILSSNKQNQTKYRFMKSMVYDYDNNMKLRSNDNYAFYDERVLTHDLPLMQHEFTQSPPDTPQNINTIPKDTRAKIVWDKVNNADTYNIKRSTSPNGPYTTIAQNILETEYEDTGMTNGIAYYYVVTAVNDGGESANSAEVAITPNPQLPQAPMNLTVTPRDNAIELTWQPIYNADNYQVMRSETEGGPYVSVLESTTNTTFTDTNVVFGKTYYYVVQAKNTTGTSNNSAEAQGVPGQVLPTTPTNIITKVKDKSVHLTWDAANDATSYNLMRSKYESGPYILIHEQIRGISCNDSDVAYGETYYYKILAVNERGESEPTQPIRVHVMDTTEQKVLLSLTMKHGTTKDYILTQSQLADFMKWYQDKTQNIGLPYFTVMGKNNYGAYKAHKSYILFDAILSMDIKEIQDK